MDQRCLVPLEVGQEFADAMFQARLPETPRPPSKRMLPTARAPNAPSLDASQPSAQGRDVIIFRSNSPPGSQQGDFFVLPARNTRTLPKPGRFGSEAVQKRRAESAPV
jgi:hypothetical protein